MLQSSKVSKRNSEAKVAGALKPERWSRSEQIHAT
jgi:hypothetical protein